jgi:hypothetical protein
MNKAMWLLTSAAVCLAAADPGIKPRAAVEDYPVRGSTPSVSIGAHRLSAGEVSGGFATDLSPGYIVLEVAVYPNNGKSVDLGPGDFLLRRAGTKEAVRPAAPKAIAAALQRSAAHDREITLSPTVGVGYESGPRGYDPVYGRRGGGVNTSVGVGVGVGGNQAPASTPEDRKTMALELGEKQLPEKVISGPVAGYLYFPLAEKKRLGAWELEYDGPAGKVTLPLEPEAPRK